MGINLSSIIEKFPELLKFEKGDKNAPITGLQTAALAAAGDIIFLSEAKHLADTATTRAGTWVVSLKLVKDLPASFKGNLLVSPNPYLAMALVGKEFFPAKPGIVPVDGQAIHSSAVIAQSARLGKNVRVGPGAIISDGCVIGDDAIVGANTVLEPHVKVGQRTHIHPLNFVGHSCEIGDDCEIKPSSIIGGEGFGFAHDAKGDHYRITHYGRVIIENRVHIGSGVHIDRGTFEDSRIGENVIIDNHCHFGHNIRIGHHTIVTGGNLMAGSVTIGNHCVFGGGSIVTGHVQVTDKVQLAGRSVVSKSVDKSGQYGDYPLQPVKDALKARATLALLPQLRKHVSKILKKLDMEE